jgi:hypothetical protein
MKPIHGKGRPTQRQPDLASPRWYAAQNGKYWLCFTEVEKQQRQAGDAPVRLPDSGCISLVSILFSGAEACPRVLIIVDFELPLVGPFSVLV